MSESGSETSSVLSPYVKNTADNEVENVCDEDDDALLAPELQPLRDALVDKRPPFCSGVLPVDEEELILFYAKGDNSEARRINFLNASSEALEHLASACDLATFGHGRKDVLDESYRKAGKLDSANFSTKLDVDSANSNLMDCVRYNLLQGHQGQRHIKAELYKLNVYGKDAFFKAHKDTPRSPSMFGSLVVVLPAAHEGGALILRHGGEEWNFDSAKAILKHSPESPHVAYAAFFSDVEHEVAVVNSGHRVTITYNLYFYDSEVEAKMFNAGALPPVEGTFTSALQKLINDSSFLTDGGYIGFGLIHEYPTDIKPADTETLDYLKKCLKGSDAVVFKACRDLGLNVEVRIFYKTHGVGVLASKRSDIDGHDYYGDEMFPEVLARHTKGEIVEIPESSSYYDSRLSVVCDLLWATKRTPFNQMKSVYGTYGNSVGSEYMYGQFCIVIEVEPAESRTALSTDKT